MTSGSWRRLARRALPNDRRIDFHFALIYETFFVAMKEFDRVLDGDDMFGTRRVDAVNHCRKGGGLTRTGDAGDQYQTASFLADALGNRREIEFLKCANFGRNDAKHDADVATLLKHIDAESPEPSSAVG